MSTFLISCGGTGGHLSPGISVAEGLVERGHKVQLLISEKRVDELLIGKYTQFEFLRVPGAPFSWNPFKLAKCGWTQLNGLWFCLRLVKRLRPDGVVGFGGFTSTAIVVAARLHGVPVVLHEANRVPGRAVRTLGRLAQRVYLPPGVRLKNVPVTRTRHVGLPVRKEIAKRGQAEARAVFGFDQNQKLVVVLGGSQGATPLNDWARREQKELAGEGVQMCCITGLDKGRDGAVDMRTKTGEPVRAYYLEFCSRVADLLSAADLVVSRAGAGTIAELIRCETPAILVPFPHAADNHQRANAAYFEQQGGGLVIEQDQLWKLRAAVVELVFNEARLRECRGNLQRMEQTNPLELLLGDLERIVAEKHDDPAGAEATA